MSPSIYIGKELAGKYLLQRIRYFDDPEYHPTVNDPRVRNPVGWFFDSRSSTSPFMTLYEFLPGINPNTTGFGMLDFKPLIIWSGVDWSIPTAGGK